MLVQQLTQGLLEGKVSGLLGLAFLSLASTNAVPFWLAVINSNPLMNPEMSFWLARDVNPVSATSLGFGGVFTFGGTNSTFYSGEIEFLDLVVLKSSQSTELSYWLLPFSSKFSV